MHRLHLGDLTLPDLHIRWSDEVCAIHEVPPGTAPSPEVGFAFCAPEFRDDLARRFEACVRDGTPFDIEYQVVTAKPRRTRRRHRILHKPLTPDAILREGV